MLQFVKDFAALVIVICFATNALARIPQGSVNYQSVNGITINKETVTHPASEQTSAIQSSPLWKDLSLVYKIYQQCSSENLSICLKVKLLTGLERVFRSAKSLKIIDGVQFVKQSDDDSDNANKQTTQRKASVTEKEIEAILPRSSNAKEQALNTMILNRIVNYLQDHTLQVKFSPSDYSENSTVESRAGKKDKKGGGAYIMIPLLLGGTFVPIAYGALAMLAGKALIVSKLALVLASIIGIKKLLGGGGGGKESHEVVVSGGHSGWGRDFDLAYSGWKPTKDIKKN